MAREIAPRRICEIYADKNNNEKIIRKSLWDGGASGGGVGDGVEEGLLKQADM